MRLPVRTALLQNLALLVTGAMQCDYQSERHCSKTCYVVSYIGICAITSQNGTAPKLGSARVAPTSGAITSQNGTAPKLPIMAAFRASRAITSQNGTAPKLDRCWCRCWLVRLPVRTALLQNTLCRNCAEDIVRLPVRTALLQNHDIGR